MRLKNYLIELYDPQTGEKLGSDFDESVNIFADLVRKNCGPYLKALKGKEPFIRGMRQVEKYYFPHISGGKKPTRQSREPKLFPKEAFGPLNNYLEKQGGARRDKSVIATTISRTLSFGPMYWIFPIGRLKYSYVTSHDFNEDSGIWDPKRAVTFFLGNYPPAEKKDYEEYFKNKIIHNKNLEKAYEHQYEIWFECKEYYFFLAQPKSYGISLLKNLNLVPKI